MLKTCASKKKKHVQELEAKDAPQFSHSAGCGVKFPEYSQEMEIMIAPN